MTAKEVREALGYTSDDSFTYQRNTRPDLHPPFVRVGHRVMYWESKVKEWLDGSQA